MNRKQAESVQSMLSRAGFMANLKADDKGSFYLYVPDSVQCSNGLRQWREFKIETIVSLEEAVRFIQARE